MQSLIINNYKQISISRLPYEIIHIQMYNSYTIYGYQCSLNGVKVKLISVCLSIANLVQHLSDYKIYMSDNIVDKISSIVLSTWRWH